MSADLLVWIPLLLCDINLFSFVVSQEFRVENKLKYKHL